MLLGFTGPAAAQEDTADEQGLALSPSAIAIDEGATATYTVALNTLPTGNVRVVLIRSSYGILFQPYTSELTFTPENWDVPQPVTLRAPQDGDTLDGAETVYHFVYGSGYTGPRRVDLEVTIADDDAAALKSLVLEDVTLNEAFDPGRTSYTATVDEAVETVTVGAAAKDDRAELTMPRDRDARQPGVQVNLDEGENVIAVRVFARNGSNRTYAITVTRPERVITASFANHPAMHVGRPFRVELKLSDRARIPDRRMRKRAFTVTGGRITSTLTLSARRVTVDGERYLVSNRWRMAVRPDGDGPVTLSLAAARPCNESGAICTPSGHRVGNAPSLTVGGPEGVTVSLHPPSSPTPETADQMLFTLRISRPVPRPVIFCWRTVDTTPAPTHICPWAATAASPGSATAGADYRPYSGFFLLDPGQTSQELGVELVDDSIDDNGETVRVEIAHARFLNSNNAPGVAIPIGASEAVGVIANTGAIPSAWLAQFGRTVAEQVVDAVRDRASATRHRGFAARLAGHAFGDPACSGGEVRAPAARSRETVGLAERARPAPAGLPGVSRAAGDGTPSAGAGRCGELTAPPEGAPVRQLRDPTPEEAIEGTSLALNFATAAQSGVSEDGLASLWLEGAAARFDSSQSGVAVDGTVTSGLFGADYAQERWSAGLAMSVSRGTGNYRGETSGRIEASLTGLYPWGHYAPNDRMRLWGGGDAETGLGLELAGGLAWSDASLGLTGQVRVRAVRHRADGAFELEGVSGALRWNPLPSSAVGPSLSLRPGLGASSSSATAASFGPAPNDGVRAGGDRPLQPRLDVELGYGLPVFGGRLAGVPELGASLSAGLRTYRLGWRLSPAAGRPGSAASPGSGSFDLSVEAMRRERAARAPEHELRIQLKAQF